MHEQEELQGHVMQSDSSMTIISLAFKRKVFFMAFAEKYLFSTLMKIYLMLLHPLFSLKYRMDPEVPRFYRFLMLYSRLMLLFGLTFWLYRDVANFEDLTSDELGITVFEALIFLILGSFLLVPVPILLLCCCRSRYYLIDKKDPSDNKPHVSDPEDFDGSEDLSERVTDIMIDTTIPIKLLFLVNAHHIEELKKEHQGKLCYITGELNEVGKKLYDLDPEIQKTLAKAKQSTDESESGENR